MNHVDSLRAALLAYDLAGRSLSDEEVDSSIRWVDRLLRLRQDAMFRADTITVNFLDREIHRRCESVDQDRLDRAAEHLQRYHAERPADQS